MEIKLFDDQNELVNKVRHQMRTSKAVLLQSPTGSGKTSMAIHMITSARDKANKTIFAVPRKDLLEQTSNSFNLYGAEHSFIASGKPYNPHSQTHIGMIDTMARRLDKLPSAKLLIVDETHYGQGSLDKVINHYKAQGAWILGLSGSPVKSNGKGLDCWYDTMVQGKSIRWLIDNKRLSEYVYYRGVSKPDLSRIKISNGEYNQHDLAGYMEHETAIIGDCVRDYKSRCLDKIHITRCTSIRHSQKIAEEFRNQGIIAAHVDGETPMDERKKIYTAFAKREIKVVTFSNLLNFGFDLEQTVGFPVTIESGSDLKPNKSLAEITQFRGRLLRMKEEPAVFNDHVNNWIEHGYPCFPREWSLEGEKKGTREGVEKAIPIQSCSKCYFVAKPWGLICPNCGDIREIQSREVEQVEGELLEVTKEMIMQQKVQARQEQGMAKTLEELQAIGKAKGYHKAWAFKVFAERKQ